MTDTSSTAAPAFTCAIRQTTSSNDNEHVQRDSHFVIAKCRRNTDVTTNETLSTRHVSTDESDAEEKLLAVYCRAGKLGAAYYTLQTGELYVLEEIVDRPPEYEMFSNLLRQVEPVTVLLDGKDQGSFVQLVRKTVFDTGSSDEGQCKLVFLSAREYSFEACKRRIHSLSLPNEPTSSTEEERILFLRTVVDFSQTQSIHALGALLRYLDLHWTSMNLGLQSKPLFLSLKFIYLDDIMSMDADSYRGLQIFNTLSHPSNFKRGAHGSSREGLSLFQLFSKCCSKIGQSRLRILMQHPTRNLTTLKRRQDVVEFFMCSQNDSIMRNICSSLKFIKNVNGILAKIKALSAKAYQWKSLYNTIYNAVLICEMCENAGKSSEFLEQLASIDNNKLYEMALYMNRIIDFDLSKSEGKFTVKTGVDSELDMKKQTMASLQGLMSETAKVELARLPAFIEECTMLYMPHLGYLLGVKAWADDLTMQQKTLPDMTFMFQNNDYIHYKSKGCEELDMVIGDTYPEIVAHETRIMMRLTDVLLENLHTLATVIDKCAELDCLISISKACKEFGYTRPTFAEHDAISIQQGKHPLHMVSGEGFVPNDADSGPGAGRVTILTGPNSCGKSVYLKQIGLIVYLAHIGSFVPCAGASLCPLRRLRTRLFAAEGVAAHMSAFLIDLKQMSSALEGGECGGGSGGGSGGAVVLADEPGRGAAAAEGRALLAAWLATLLARPPHRCPHVFLSTHFHDLHRFIVETPMVKFLSFEYLMQDGEPVFLFRVREVEVGGEGGVVGVGEVAGAGAVAGAVAGASGVPAHVVKRAADVMGHVVTNTLPPENKKITAKLRKTIEIITNELLADDI